MKKVLVILLSILLLFTALPLGALSVSAATSGTTGSCTWTLNGTVLTISGNGAMRHYDDGTKTPWGTAVTKVVVEEGVTRIGAHAFYGCKSLAEVVIPDTLTIIGVGAFYNCDSLTEITIPDSVTLLGYDAFRHCDALMTVVIGNGVPEISTCTFEYCKSLSSVTIGSSVTYIGGGAFRYCTSLTSVVVPDNVTTIMATVFKGCTALSSVTLPESLSYLSQNVFTDTAYYEDPANWENDVLYIGNCLIKAKDTLSGSYTVKSGTRLIAFNAFRNCTSLTAVTLPDSVAVIMDSAFYDCESLSSITIPDRVVSIGSSAFYNAAYYANSANWENDVLYVGNHLIKAKETLSGTYAVRPGTLTIAERAFYNCTELTEVILPDSIVAIEAEAFSSCKAITAMTLPFVGENADGSGATYLGYLFGATTYFDNVTYVPSSLQSVTISGTAVGAFAFYGCNALTSMTLSDRVTAIGKYAFYNCSGLSSIPIPDGVTAIEDSTFYGCSSLTSVTLPDAVTSIGESVFRKCSSLTSATIPDGVTAIGKWAFNGCSSLSEVDLPLSITSIERYAFNGCSSLSDVYYSGAVEDRAAITVATGNSPLNNATWHCHEHVYDHSCDEDCNECGRVRTDAHVFDSVCDADCNECDFVRADIHVFDSVCDTECNACGFVREVPHAYDNDCDVDCNLCGGVREVPDHRYNGICDVDCNECGTVRFAEPHRYDDANDLVCNQCGFERVSCLIYTADDLYAFAQQVNSGNTQIDGTLMNDIVVNENVFVDGVFNADGASAFRSWVAMGTEENPYTGTFDGNGYTVYGLYAKTNMEIFGFFAHNAGTVQDLRLADVYFYIDGEEDAYDDLGGICARNEAGGILADCSVAGTIYNHSGRYGSPDAAGICADNAGVITRCYNEATIEASGSRSDPDTGGICSSNRGVIEYCYNLGKVYAHAGTSGDNSIWAQSGGISVTNLGIIRYCFNGGEVIASASGGHEDALATRAGGICVHNYTYGSIENCFNTGDVSGSASSWAFEDWFCASADVGGIVATNYGAAVIRNCKSIGTVTATVTTSGSDYRATQDDLCPSNAGTMEESGYTADAFANGDVCATLTYHPEQVVVIPPTDAATYVCAVCGHSHTDLPPILYGDANGDGAVNARDAALLQQYVAGWDVTLVEASADANGDGAVNARDAALLQQYVAGWDVA